jgi:hypothetical protein
LGAGEENGLSGLEFRRSVAGEAFTNMCGLYNKCAETANCYTFFENLVNFCKISVNQLKAAFAFECKRSIGYLLKKLRTWRGSSTKAFAPFCVISLAYRDADLLLGAVNKKGRS